MITTISTGGCTQLTSREREVLAQLALGRTTEEAGEAIFLSPHTVRCHVKSAMRKLGAHTRPHAVALAIALGEVDVDALAA